MAAKRNFVDLMRSGIAIRGDAEPGERRNAPLSFGTEDAQLADDVNILGADSERNTPKHAPADAEPSARSDAIMADRHDGNINDLATKPIDVDRIVSAITGALESVVPNALDIAKEVARLTKANTGTTAGSAAHAANRLKQCATEERIVHEAGLKYI